MHYISVEVTAYYSTTFTHETCLKSAVLLPTNLPYGYHMTTSSIKLREELHTTFCSTHLRSLNIMVSV